MFVSIRMFSLVIGLVVGGEGRFFLVEPTEVRMVHGEAVTYCDINQ